MTDHGGDDEAIRRVRYYLVAHPDHQPALDALESLTESVRSRLAAARAKAESESESFQSDVSRFRRYVVGGLAVFWTLALALALYLVFG
jgi:ferric-dicitrate binding protein FerR (iron transport regulator)